MWIKRSTYNALLETAKEVDQENTNLKADNQRLKGELNRLGDKVVEITKQLSDAQRRLAKYNRQRGAGGKFVKK